MKPVSIRRDIYLYLFGLVLSLSAVYAIMVNQSYQLGFYESAQYGLLYELALAEQHYLSTGELPLTSSATFSIYAQIEQIPAVFLEHFEWSQLAPGVVYEHYLAGRSGGDGTYLYATLHQVAASDTVFYVVSQYDEAVYNSLYAQTPPESEQGAGTALVLIGGLLVLVFLLSRLLIHRITQPIITLSCWSQTLDLDRADMVSSFRYREVAQLASQLVSSVRNHQQAIEREEFFLRAASHELRTPVATIAASGDLLERLPETMSAAGNRAVARINRAVITMQNLITSLLWMSRNQPLETVQEPIDLHRLCHEIVATHGYLIEETQTVIEVGADMGPITLNKTVAEIVVTNLIRNAMQHSHGGQIEVTPLVDGLMVANDIEPSSGNNKIESFGLGLVLVERLCQSQGWQFKQQLQQGRYCAQVTFNAR